MGLFCLWLESRGILGWLVVKSGKRFIEQNETGRPEVAAVVTLLSQAVSVKNSGMAMQ